MPRLNNRLSSGVQLSEPVRDTQTVHEIRKGLSMHPIHSQITPNPRHKLIHAQISQKQQTVSPSFKTNNNAPVFYQELTTCHRHPHPLTHSQTLPINPLTTQHSLHPTPPLCCTPAAFVYNQRARAALECHRRGMQRTQSTSRHTVGIISCHPSQKKKKEWKKL